MIDRAYSRLTIRSADDEQRRIRGMATTPTTDRLGDVVEPLGVSFRNPLPLLRGHSSAEPVGTAVFDSATGDGIEFEATLPKIAEPGPLKDRVDTAWGEIKAGLVRGVSIGFRSIEHAAMKGGGLRFLKTEVLELSLVPIPANADATIQTIKSIDAELLAATGRMADRGAGRSAAGVTARPGVRAVEARAMTTKPVADQIRTFEATRQAKAAAMDAIMAASAEAGATLDAAQKEEHDGLAAEVGEIDEHLKRLADMEKRQAAGARAVDDRAGASASGASAARGNGTSIVVGRRTLPPGTAFVRYVMAFAASRGNVMQAAEIAKKWRDETPEVELVLRAAVTAGTTTDADWAGPLVNYQNMASEFVELLRPGTIIGRVPGLRRVPFKVKLPVQTQGSNVQWVGETAPKPVGELKFTAIMLDVTKAAGIVVLSEELVRLSTPSAEETVKTDLRNAMQQFLDVEFIDPSRAPEAGVSPGSILNGVTGIPSTGGAVDDVRADVQAIRAAFLGANLSMAGGVWVTTETIAGQLMDLRNPLGQPEFPGVTVTGGTFQGLPLVPSEAVPAGILAMIKANEVLLADDGQVAIDMSNQATLLMDSAPAVAPSPPPPAPPQMFSLWQNNCVGIRAERWINWKRRRNEAVSYVTGANYTGV